MSDDTRPGRPVGPCACPPGPTTPLPSIAITAATLFTAALVLSGQASAQQKETIFDGVVHLEPTVLTESPETPRLEESLGISGRLVSVGDVALWVEEEGAGTPLVLINGGPGGTHHGFHPWFGRAAGFSRVIYYDQRGCGLSDYEPGPDGYSVDQAVEDLEGLRKALELDRFVLLGFSYGGFLAQYYTTRYPEHVAGLVLVGASPGMKADLGRSRQREFMSPEELERRQVILRELRELAPSRGWSSAELLALIVYNNHINGDWKRQHYYKPSPERMAQIALYEWVQDDNFNSVVGQSQGGIDFTGAFDANPIPTLLMEGAWDLTWGHETRYLVAGNHPNGKLVTFEEAGHSIFNEDPEGFFSTLEAFILGLTPPSPDATTAFRSDLEIWREALVASPGYHLAAVDWGWSASREIAEAFEPGWVGEITSPTEYLRLGFALYDMKRYDEALEVFTRFQEWGQREGEVKYSALASIWQGHMLDLLGRRSEALTVYQQVADLNLDDTWSHGQYGLRYALSPWAAERLEAPFQRIENGQG